MPQTMNQPLIAELKREAATTRRVLERVPEDKLSWKPHPKSMSLGQLALHVAVIPGALADFLSELKRESPDFSQRPAATSRADLLAALDQGTAAAATKLSTWSDDDLMANWTMTRGTKTLMVLPRIEMVRSIMFNHWYHHRGQLGVYLRLLDVPLPSVYGPTADEDPMT
jgi:uncharacterized damage-inducible protein DinB